MRGIGLSTAVVLVLSLGACHKALPHGTQVGTDEARQILDAYDHAAVQPWREPRQLVPSGVAGEQIREGLDLLLHTSQRIGPNAPDATKRYSANNLNCVQCHQAGPSGLPGTKAFVLPYMNVAHDYPKLDVKSMQVLDLEERIVGMLGHGAVKATPQTPEVLAMAAYMRWLGQSTRADERMTGEGLEALAAMDRAADPVAGKALYDQLCVGCHGATGQGKPAPDFAHGGGYTFPAIAGDDSFDDGGHMYVVPTLARFIHSAMPPGASHDAPVLSIPQAYDIAAYVDSALPRHHDAARAHCYPNPAFRPAGFAIPELYSDPQTLAHAKFGPFKPPAQP